VHRHLFQSFLPYPCQFDNISHMHTGTHGVGAFGQESAASSPGGGSTQPSNSGETFRSSNQYYWEQPTHARFGEGCDRQCDIYQPRGRVYVSGGKGLQLHQAERKWGEDPPFFLIVTVVT
jgi:hypothetical protein